ncbi:EAL domain-containing protein [Litoreibacter roseus]|uniref:Diguanylate phosphodiesterase n=1 Tax=Litoreibacter roseus TaxID=2601869 RepID=A0A6N6JJZ8_9RHOB|nr:EAL domain-containing protein [Litoreibacter roseus]GFE66365.1 diguanylate phosphodiesterase [Litoreibacter roseus]
MWQPGHPAESESPLATAIAMRDAGMMETVKTALRLDRVALAFQPVVRSGGNGRPAFYEALLRIRDEKGRILPAQDFIEAIETREEGRLMDCLALKHGLAALAADPQLRLSINMSPRTIGYPAWEVTLHAGLTENPTVAERLIIEVTETSAMTMPDLVKDFMDRMHLLGVSFALDDFGAGYTSFRHFKDFFFDIVKIDGSFCTRIDEDRDNQVLMAAMVSIARQFEMFVVVEGVQRREEAEYLASIGVECLQGYYFAAPSMTYPKDDHHAAPLNATG